MKVVIIKYNAGNIRSMIFALERLGIQTLLTDKPEDIMGADKVIFPGVGEASTTMACLKEKGLDRLIPALKQPVLGICLGMQLMCSYSEEGNTPCLNIFPQQVKLFRHNLKVPHMGWNTIYNMKGGLFNGIREKEYVYFVHSYYVEHGEHTVATSVYGNEFSASLQRGNFYTTQFHPEKSGNEGQKIISNFLKL